MINLLENQVLLLKLQDVIISTWNVVLSTQKIFITTTSECLCSIISWMDSMIPHSGMYFWHLFQKNYNKKFSVSWLLIGSTLTHYHWENYSRLLWDVLTNCVNKRDSSRNSWKTKNLSDLLAKSLTWLSSAKIQRSVTAHPRKSLISRNLDSHFHPGNGVPNSFAFLEKGNPIQNSFLIERKVGVSFAKRKVILPKIVLSNLIRQ